MSRQTSLRGFSTGLPAYGADTRADLNSFPLPACSILERSEIRQSAIDIGAALFGFLFLSITGVGVAAAIFILLFVRI
jgi:hypothetical protein